MESTLQSLKALIGQMQRVTPEG